MLYKVHRPVEEEESCPAGTLASLNYLQRLLTSVLQEDDCGQAR